MSLSLQSRDTQKKKCAEKTYDDFLKNDILNKDGYAFWKLWKKLNDTGDSTATRISGKTDAKEIANIFASYFESVYGDHDTLDQRLSRLSLKKSMLNTFSSIKVTISRIISFLGLK